MESVSKDKRLEKLINEAKVALTAVCDHVLGEAGDGSATPNKIAAIKRSARKARKAGLDTPRRRKMKRQKSAKAI